MSVVYERLHAETRSRRLRASVFAGVPLAIAAALALAVGLESTRRGLRLPSLVDDWFGIAYGGHAFEAIKHLHYGAEHVDVAGRYRPAYTGIWNYLQWHVLGPPSVDTALAWGIARAAAFAFAVWALARWTAQRAAPLAAALAAVAVCLTPGFAVDLTRHGPADPQMLLGLIFGLASVGIGVRTLLAHGAHRARAVALIASGYVLYLFGAYSKEASVALFAFAPFFFMWARPALRELGHTRIRRIFLGCVAAGLAAPLLHVGFHVALAVANGDNPYPTATFSLSRKILAAVVFPVVGAPGPLGTLFWLAVTPAAIAYVGVAAWRRRREAWLLSGLLTTGYLMSAFSLARGDTPSRYYLPWIVSVSAVAARALTRPNGRLVACAAALVVAVMTATSTRAALGTWADTERSGEAAIGLADGVTRAGCPLYLVNFDVERRVAIPRLVAFAHSPAAPRCAAASRQAYALEWSGQAFPRSFTGRCPAGWTKLKERTGVSLYHCTAFRRGAYLDQEAASGAPSIHVVRLSIPTNDRSPRTFTRRSEVPKVERA